VRTRAIADQCRQPYYRVCPVKVALEGRSIADIAIRKVDRFKKNIFVNQAVVHPHGVSGRDQPVGDTATDVSCAANDENLRHNSYSHPSFFPLVNEPFPNRRGGLRPFVAGKKRVKLVDNNAPPQMETGMKRCFASVALGLALAAMTGCGRNPETTPPPADSTTAASPANATTTTAKPSHATYSLAWGTHNAPPTMVAGTPVAIQVTVKNTGDWVWNHPAAANPSKPDGTYAVRLAYNWVSPDGKTLPANNTRGELTAPVPPGQNANFTIDVQTPKVPGTYQLQFDLVEEMVVFFSSKGNEKLTVPVTVQ
jgi:predicted small lipoprotein YifL